MIKFVIVEDNKALQEQIKQLLIKISISTNQEYDADYFSKYNDKMIIVISHRNKNQDLFNKKYQLKGGGVIDEIKW